MVEMGPAPRTAEWAGGLISSLPLHPFVIIWVWLSTSHPPNETCTRQPLPPTQTYPESVHLCRLLKTLTRSIHTLTFLLNTLFIFIATSTHLRAWQTFRQKQIFRWMVALYLPTFSWKAESGRYSTLIPWHRVTDEFAFWLHSRAWVL